jgi:hypothetical protein
MEKGKELCDNCGEYHTTTYKMNELGMMERMCDGCGEPSNDYD